MCNLREVQRMCVELLQEAYGQKGLVIAAQSKQIGFHL